MTKLLNGLNRHAQNLFFCFLVLIYLVGEARENQRYKSFLEAGPRFTLEQGYKLCLRIRKLEQRAGILIPSPKECIR